MGTPCGQTLMSKFLESPTTNPVSPCTVGSETGFSDMYLNRGPRTMGSWHFDSVNPPIPEGLESWLNRAHAYVTLSVLFLWPLIFLFKPPPPRAPLDFVAGMAGQIDRRCHIVRHLGVHKVGSQ